MVTVTFKGHKPPGQLKWRRKCWESDKSSSLHLLVIDQKTEKIMESENQKGQEFKVKQHIS